MRTRSSMVASSSQGSVKRTSQRNRLLRTAGELMDSTANVSGGETATIDIGGSNLLTPGSTEGLASTASRTPTQVKIPQLKGQKPTNDRKMAKRTVITGSKGEAGRLHMFTRKQELGRRVEADRLKSIAARNKVGTNCSADGNDQDGKHVMIRLNPVDIKCTSDPACGSDPGTVSGLFTLHMASPAKTLHLPLSMDPRDVEHLLANVYHGKPTNAIINSPGLGAQSESGPFASQPSAFSATVAEKTDSLPMDTSPAGLPTQVVTASTVSLSLPACMETAAVTSTRGLFPDSAAGVCPSTTAADLSALSVGKSSALRTCHIDCRVRTNRSHFPIKKRLSVHYKQYGYRAEDLASSSDCLPVGSVVDPGTPPAPVAGLKCPGSTEVTNGVEATPICLPLPPAPQPLENFILPRPAPAAQTMMVMMSSPVMVGASSSNPVDSQEASKRLAIVLPVNFLSPPPINGSLAFQQPSPGQQLILLPQMGGPSVALVPQPASQFGHLQAVKTDACPGKRATPVSMVSATCRVTNSLIAPIPAPLVVPSAMQMADSTSAAHFDAGRPVGVEARLATANLLPRGAVNGIDNLLAADRYLNYCSISTRTITMAPSLATDVSAPTVQPSLPSVPARTAPPVVTDAKDENRCKTQSDASPIATVGYQPLMPNPSTVVRRTTSTGLGKTASKRRTSSAVVRGRYRCQECGLACLKPCLLRKHIRTHYDVRPYMCQHCNIAFKTRGNLSKHMKSRCHTERCSKDVENESSQGSTKNSVQIDTRALEKQRLLSLDKTSLPEVKRPGRYRSIRACPTEDVKRITAVRDKRGDEAENETDKAGEQPTAPTSPRSTTPASRIPAPNVNVVHLQQDLPLNLSVRPTQPTSLLDYTKQADLNETPGSTLQHTSSKVALAGSLTNDSNDKSSLQTGIARQLTASSAEKIIRSAVAAAIQSTHVTSGIQQAPRLPDINRRGRRSMTTNGASNEGSGVERRPFASLRTESMESLACSAQVETSNGCSGVRAEGGADESIVAEVTSNESAIEDKSVEACPLPKREPRPYKCSACRVGFRVTGHLHKHYRAKSHLLAVLQANNLPTEACESSQLSPSDLIDPETGMLKERADQRISGHGQRTVVSAGEGV